MPRVRAVRNGSGLVYREGAGDGGASATSTTRGGSPARRPFLLHANGKHYRLADRALAPLMRRLASDEVASRAEEVPVLLVDSVARGTCGVATLGQIMRGWEKRTVAPRARA